VGCRIKNVDDMEESMPDPASLEEPEEQSTQLSWAEELRLLREERERRAKEQKEAWDREFEEIVAKRQREQQEKEELKKELEAAKRTKQAETRKANLPTQPFKEWEDKRVKEITSHRDEWGDWMCQQLVINGIDPYSQKTLEILKRLPEWGQDNCLDILTTKIRIGMTAEMVRLAFGEPTTEDEKVISPKGNGYRWIYGYPRQGAVYIWFKNDKVTKIKT
jgi:hypothetical protein